MSRPPLQTPISMYMNKITESLQEFNNHNMQNNIIVRSNIQSLVQILNNMIERDKTSSHPHPQQQPPQQHLQPQLQQLQQQQQPQLQQHPPSHLDDKPHHPISTIPSTIDNILKVINDLQKQIEMIQYYTQLQNVFISQIMQHVDSFQEHVFRQTPPTPSPPLPHHHPTQQPLPYPLPLAIQPHLFPQQQQQQPSQAAYLQSLQLQQLQLQQQLHHASSSSTPAELNHNPPLN